MCSNLHSLAFLFNSIIFRRLCVCVWIKQSKSEKNCNLAIMQHVCGATFYPDFHPTPHTATTHSSHQPLELTMNDFFELRELHIKGADRVNERSRAGHNSLMSREMLSHQFVIALLAH